MFRKSVIVMILVLMLSAWAAKADVIDSNWAGGTRGQWGQASNWNPAIVPDNGGGDTFVVTIDSNAIGVDEIEVGLQQSSTIDQLDCYGYVNLEKWTSGWVELTLVEPGGLTNYGVLDIEDLEINGNLYNHAGGMVEIDGDVSVENGDVENAGVLIVNPFTDFSAEPNLNNAGQISIHGGMCGANAVIDNNSTGTIAGFGILYANVLLRNKGTIYAYGDSLVVVSEGSLLNSGTLGNNPLSSLQIKPAADVNNFGTIEVNVGGGVAFDCNVVNEPNATIELNGGTLAAHSITQSADADFAGFGSLAGDVVIEPDGLIKLTGPTNIFGNVEIGAGATLEISDGTTLIAGYTTNNGTIHMKGGRLIPQGGITNGNIIWEPGTYSNAADFNLDGQVNFKDFSDFADTWLWQSQWQ